MFDKSVSIFQGDPSGTYYQLISLMENSSQWLVRKNDWERLLGTYFIVSVINRDWHWQDGLGKLFEESCFIEFIREVASCVKLGKEVRGISNWVVLGICVIRGESVQKDFGSELTGFLELANRTNIKVASAKIVHSVFEKEALSIIGAQCGVLSYREIGLGREITSEEVWDVREIKVVIYWVENLHMVLDIRTRLAKHKSIIDAVLILPSHVADLLVFLKLLSCSNLSSGLSCLIQLCGPFIYEPRD